MLRMVKLFAWEPHIIEKLTVAREAEVKKLRRGRLLEAVNSGVSELIPLVTKTVVFAIYVSHAQIMHLNETLPLPTDVRHEEGINACVFMIISLVRRTNIPIAASVMFSSLMVSGATTF